MNDKPDNPDEPGEDAGNDRSMDELFERLFSQASTETDMSKLAEAMGLPADEESIKKALGHLRQFIANQPKDGSASWNLALEQARTIAAKNSEPISEQTRAAVAQALPLALLWLGQATTISVPNSEPKLLSRELWVQDAFPLLRSLAGSVADRMGAALSESMPSDEESANNQVVNMLRWLGNSMVAMQLGEAVAALANEAIGGGDIGLPIFEEQRPAFVAQNLKQFATELPVEDDQVYLYLVVRELAHVGLFKHARWLRDHVLQQISAYAKDIHIDDERVREAAEGFDPAHPEKLQRAIRDGELLADRNEDQLKALEAIETMLALIEGWVDAVSAEATKLLPKSAAIQEGVRRRRATGGPAEKTFGTLIGLELRPRKMREASAIWQQLTERYGAERRDSLWEHPDLLPTAAELANADQLFARLDDRGDDIDLELRKLLDE